jgi:hypothetical protein
MGEHLSQMRSPVPAIGKQPTPNAPPLFDRLVEIGRP